MEKIDVIILANNVDLNHEELTKVTLDTLLQTESDVEFNIILIESCKESKFLYPNIKTIVPTIPFNYGDYVNIGYEYCENEWVLIINNDLEFTKNWLSEIKNALLFDSEIKSFSPYEPNFHKQFYGDWFNENSNIYYGHKVPARVAGWCILHKRDILEEVGLFDNQFQFYYIDDDYGKRLETKNIKHVLVYNSIVYHKTNKSHDTIPNLTSQKAMNDMKELFIKKWGE
jgi:hypothetical protein